MLNDILANLHVNAPVFVLGLLLVLGILVMRSAQRRDDFDWGNMLKDENGKESAMRFAVFVSLAVSSWVLLYLTMHAVEINANLDKLFDYYLLYISIWSGAKIVEKALDVLLLKFGGKPQAPTA